MMNETIFLFSVYIVYINTVPFIFRKNFLGLQIEYSSNAHVEEVMPAVTLTGLVGKLFSECLIVTLIGLVGKFLGNVQ